MKRSFKGIFIPKEIWEDTRLTILEKGVFAEIDSLDGEEHCYASNEYLAEFCGCTERSISNAIKKLIDLGYIRKIGFNGRTRILASNLHYTVAYVLSAEDDFPEATQCGLDDQGRVEKSSIISMQSRKNFYADSKEFPVSNYNNIYNNTNEKIEENIKEKQTQSIETPKKMIEQDPFDIFWKAYPNKTNKDYARTCFKKAIHRVDLKTMLSAIEKQKKLKEQQIREKIFSPHWPYASTWLNQNRWNDDTELPESEQHEAKLFDHESQAYKDAKWLSEEIHINNPSLEEKPEEVLQEWAAIFDDLVKVDHHPHAEILKLLKYACKHEFWESKASTPQGFRKNYDKILIEAKNEGKMR